ncbi:MAG: L,D-transpeptidase family protein [bacterium]|nr:L,D-transpeptidase family protein [bacterium]
MKNKITALLLTAAVMTSYVSSIFAPCTAFADDVTIEEYTENTAEPAQADETVQTEEPENEQPAETLNPALISDAIGIDINIAPHQLVTDSTAKFNLFDSNGNLVGTSEQWIGGDTRSIRLQFSVPPYIVGSAFTLGLADGLKSLKYYDNTIAPGGSFILETYAMSDEIGNIIHGNNFAMDAEPNYQTAVNFYYDNNQIPLWPVGQIVDGIGMVSAYDIGRAVGMKVQYHADYNSLTMSLGSSQLIFNIGSTYSTFFGNDVFISHAPVWAGDAILVPIRDTLNALGCAIDLWLSDDHIDVIANKSPVITEFRNKERVNREGISSRTSYLVWVSKSNYQVKLYQGSRYNWECILTAPCAIGAPGSPTIEGQFEYQYNGGVWSYPNFYVSPTLVFYGGYALHSTLKAWGGGMYDDSVGVQISHGCVRLHPKDIDFIYKTIPIGTKIYVTP